jgi:hypothetical protein
VACGLMIAQAKDRGLTALRHALINANKARDEQAIDSLEHQIHLHCYKVYGQPMQSDWQMR